MALPQANGGGGVYWVGANGNIYAKGAGVNGVSDFGSAQGTGALITKLGGGLNGFTRIADPNPPKPAAPAAAPPSNPNGGGGGGGTTYADKSNSIALNNAALGSVDAQTSSGLDAIAKALAGIMGSYDSERAANEGNYTNQSNTNQSNFQTNKQTAFVNGAAGRQGLFGSLSAIGALNGSGIKLANKAVKAGVDADVASGTSNFEGNQVNLDNAISSFRSEDDRRRKNANNAATDASTRTQNDALKNKQKIFGDLANDYAAQGDAARARDYTNQAAALFPQIAASSIPTTNLAPESAAYTPGSLSSYLSNGLNGTSVTSAPGSNGLPTLFATTTKKKQAV